MQGFQRQRGECLVSKVNKDIHLKKVVNLAVENQFKTKQNRAATPWYGSRPDQEYRYI